MMGTSSTGRFAAGVGNIVWGLRMTLTKRTLFVRSLIVIAINAAVYGGLLGAGWYYLEPVTTWITNMLPVSWQGGWVHNTIWFLLAAAWLILTVFVALGLASLITGPILDQLSEETERLLTGHVNPAPFRIRSLIYEFVVMLMMLVYSTTLCLLATLFLGWIPIVGQIIPFCIAAQFVSFNFIAPAAIRHELNLRDRIRLIKQNRMALIGFGAPVSVFPFLLVPLLTPALVVGGTRIFLQLAADESARHQLNGDQLNAFLSTADSRSIV